MGRRLIPLFIEIRTSLLSINYRGHAQIEHLIAAVCAAPGRYRRIDGDVRRHLAADFPYALLYLDEPDRVWIVAVMPLKRDPNYWKHRLSS
jgi:toxin ParE1/3/4